MVTSNFKPSLALILESEGGNDDDPEDHGGRTSRGVTQRTYDTWRIHNGLPTGDVWKATDAEISSIYHDDYWQPFCDLLPSGIDYLFFDMAINAGPRRASIILQRALGVEDDGRIGAKTLAALEQADAATLIERYTEAKRAYYIGLNQQKFIRGWLNRCDHVQQSALKMIEGD